MLAVTNASNDRDKTFAWIENLGAEYPFAFAKDGKLSELAGVEGIPHAALFDPNGKMVWTGSPYELTSGKVKEVLKGASKSITFGWGKTYGGVADSVIDNEFSDALEEVDKLAAKGVEGAEDVREAVVRKLDGRMAAMKKAFDKGDYYAALVIAESLDGNLDGLEQESAVASTLSSMEGDEEIENVLEGQKKLAKLENGKLDKKRQVEGAIDKAEKLAEKYDGTIVATQAKAFVKRLRARLASK